MNFQDRIEETEILNIEIEEYLKRSLEGDNTGRLCKGWEFLQTKLTPKLKEILYQSEYWELKYNTPKSEYIIGKAGFNISEDLRHQLDAFVYCWNTIKRDIEEQDQKEKLRAELDLNGFREIKNTQEELNGLKVECVMDINKIGILGSFKAKETLTGKLVWSDYHKCLMLIPKKCRTRGYLIIENVFIKEASNEKV